MGLARCGKETSGPHLHDFGHTTDLRRYGRQPGSHRLHQREWHSFSGRGADKQFERVIDGPHVALNPGEMHATTEVEVVDERAQVAKQGPFANDYEVRIRERGTKQICHPHEDIGSFFQR